MNDLLANSVPFVSVTVVDAVGSVPQDIGAKMLVTKDGLYFGTVGGGKVEARALAEAMRLLEVGTQTRRASDCPRTQFVNWALDRDIGMTCGGSVKMYFETFNTSLWHITIFGAGHCAQALTNLLLNLDCRVTCYDNREDWLNKLPDSAKLKRVLASDLPAEVKNIPDGSSVILMTMGHTSDKPILLEILKSWGKRKFPYLGVIGSKAKAARLHQDIDEAGLPPELKSVFYCPIGLPIGTNHPQEIAISIAAQLLEARDSASG